MMRDLGGGLFTILVMLAKLVICLVLDVYYDIVEGRRDQKGQAAGDALPDRLEKC